MTGVQLENGFTRIANELLEAMALYKFNSTQFKLLLIIIRYTYGFSRKEASLSVSYLSIATNVDKRQLRRELNMLIKLKVVTIVKEAGFTNSRIIKVNKNYNEWEMLEIKQNNPQEVIIPPEGESTPTPEGSTDPTPEGESTPQERKVLNKVLKKEESDILFKEVWKPYPKKKGVGDARKKFPGLIKEYGLDQFKRMVDRYIEKVRVEKIKDQFIMYGSTFFNGGCEDYSDENYEGQDKPQKTAYKGSITKDWEDRD